jgi:hypothetical protein
MVGGHTIISDGRNDRQAVKLAHGAWRLIGIALSLYVILTLTEFILWDAHALPGAGTIGAEQADFSTAPAAGPGFVSVAHVSKGSPLDHALVRNGDRLRFDPVFDYLRYRHVGEQVSAIVDRAGQRVKMRVTAVSRTGSPDWQEIRFYLGNLIPSIFGAFIIWRSRKRASALLLGAALVTFGPPSTSAMMWEGGRSTFLLFSTVNRACIMLVAVFLVAFAMLFVDETVRRVSRRQWVAFACYAALNFVVLICWCVSDYTGTLLPLVGNAAPALIVIDYVGFAASLAYLAIGWRRSEKAQRERFAIFLAGVAALVVSQLLSMIVFLQLNQLYKASHPLLFVAELLSGVVAPVLLTHGIMRHRVLDLGFILNRTIVYASISFILLLSFGLLEWGVEQFVRIQGREQSVLVDAVIALSVYLVFHRFRDATERGVESLLFREWHTNEAKLRHSISVAGFITEMEPLIQAATSAFVKFSKGASASLYYKGKRGDYVAADGARLGGNHPWVVEMRADLQPLRIDPSVTASPALALPMALRSELQGFVLMGPKGGESDYRPDEVEVMAWSAHQIGLDLYALRVDQLQEEVRAQDTQMKVLKARNQVYRTMGAKP